MRLSYGHGGWIGVDAAGLPGPLYVRVRPAPDGRLRVTEVYLDGSESDGVTQRDIRDLPLSRIEAAANANREAIMRRADWPAPDLSTLASYFRTRFENWGRHLDDGTHWVALSFAAQAPDELRRHGLPPVPRAPRQRRQWQVIPEDVSFRLSSGPSDGLSDDFLRDVARAYAAALARGEKPNAAMAEQTGCPLRSVQRWVYTARQRGIMPRGRRGQAG